MQAQRPALTSLLNHLRTEDTLVVWRLNRSGRSLKELITLVTTLSEKQVNFKSLNENIDTSTPTRQLIFHIFCALAEFELEVIRERTLAGLQAAKQKAQAAASLYKEGSLSVRELCSHLHSSPPTLYRYLNHEQVKIKTDQPKVDVI